MRTALTIAGSDSGGGAGIQGDLKTFAAHGVFGASALTAITAQNTRAVTAVQEISPEVIAAQIDAVLSDIRADAVKTGMLSSVEIITVVANKLREWKIENIVVDPVMVSRNGDKLLRDDAVDALKNQLLPLALVATPNQMEAEVLCGHAVTNQQEMESAARKIHALGPRYVVVKGGRIGAEALDIFFDGESFTLLRTARIETPHTHGTGCAFSAAIAANLAKGLAVVDAVSAAKAYVTAAIAQAPGLGLGHGPIQHFPRR
jgi:hydroxymethylpyrimidine/phosphomethylpyrimidine kinase